MDRAAAIAVQNTATYCQQTQILNRPVAPADTPQGIDLELACAIATRLARQPELIFLDRVMPYTNRYEICTLLRKLACFHDIPIVILTSNDGLVERVKARLVKVSDFLSNPSMLVSCQTCFAST
ncbi:MAG: hypothetical protein Fur006_59130 [Coleofasciculaceae cyanobacterium]